MPNIDLTFSISVILGLAAVVVPSVTTLLNNLHQYQLRKLELKAQQDKELRFYRQTIFENYLKYSLQYLHRIKDSELLYEEYHSLALIYFPDNFLPLVKEILSLIPVSYTHLPMEERMRAAQEENQVEAFAEAIQKAFKDGGFRS